MDYIVFAFNWVFSHWQDISSTIGSIVLGASAFVAASPSTKDDKIWGKIVKFFEFFSIFNKKTHA